MLAMRQSVASVISAPLASNPLPKIYGNSLHSHRNLPTANIDIAQLQSTLHATRISASSVAFSASSSFDDDDDTYDEDSFEDFIEVGVVGPPHGVRGEFKVQPLTDFPEERLAAPGPRWLVAPTSRIASATPSPPEPVELEWGRPSMFKGREVWLVKLEDIDSPEEAALIRNYRLLIPPSSRPPLDDEDEFYVQDLVGLRVILEATSEEIGVVVDLMDGTGTHDVLRIQLHENISAGSSSSSTGGDDEEDEEEEEEAATRKKKGKGKTTATTNPGPKFIMLPFAKALVPFVDLKAREMRVTPPDGLLELAAPATEKRPRKESGGRRDRRNQRPRRQGENNTSSDDDETGQGAASTTTTTTGAAWNDLNFDLSDS